VLFCSDLPPSSLGLAVPVLGCHSSDLKSILKSGSGLPTRGKVPPKPLLVW
jgi:hypothetical protein